MASPLNTKPALPEGLEFYRWQIAGHRLAKHSGFYDGVLQDGQTGHVLKLVQAPPRGECELDVYERVWCDSEDLSLLSSLRQFFPRFFGVKDIYIEGKKLSYLELEDVVLPFEKPCIADIKIGLRTWDPNADAKKIQYEKSKYLPYAERLGFRFLGYMAYCPLTNSYCFRDKEWGKTVKDTDVDSVFEQYYRAAGDHKEAVVEAVLEKLSRIEEWFATHPGYAFYSSSLLVIYDAADTKRPAVDVRMIDFTHVFEQKDIDTNYLDGLRSLISRLTYYRDTLKHTTKR